MARPGRAQPIQPRNLNGAQVWRCPLLLPPRMRGVWRVLAPLSFALTSGPVVFWRIMRERPGLVVCIEPTLLATPVAIVAARLSGARLALHVQDLEPESAFATISAGPDFAPMLRWLRRRFDCIVTLSDAMRQALIVGGVRADAIHIWPNWTDVRRIATGRDQGREIAWRQQLRLRADQRIALYAGTINRKHAPLLLAEAARLFQARDDIVIVLAGDGPLLPELVAAAARLPNLRFMPLQPEEKLPALLNFADVHVMPQVAALDDLMLPSRIGGMLASGKPVVVTAEPGSILARFLRGSASLCRPDDPHALATAIASAMPPAGKAADDDMRQRRARWRKALELDRRRCLPGIVDTLEGLMAKKPRSACTAHLWHPVPEHAKKPTARCKHRVG